MPIIKIAAKRIKKIFFFKKLNLEGGCCAETFAPSGITEGIGGARGGGGSIGGSGSGCDCGKDSTGGSESRLICGRLSSFNLI